MPAPAISLRNVTKRYGKARGISQVTLDVQAGEIFGFLGPNGAGKTTTIRCLMDFIRPDSGSVKIFGKNNKTESVSSRGNIGFLPADPMMYPKWTGQDHLDFYAKIRGDGDRVSVAKQLDLNLTVPVQHLSTGNKQKLALTLALYGSPKLLVLDEPTKGLDPLLQQEIYGLLHTYKQKGGTVFVSSHNLPEVEKICDRIGVIKDGSIVASETMQSIREMSIHIVTISPTTKINLADFQFSNAEILHSSDKHLILKVRGDLNQVVQAATKYKLKDIEITHANLEDIFMEYYR